MELIGALGLEGGLQRFEHRHLRVVELQCGDGAQVEVGGGGGWDRVDRGASADGAAVDGGARLARQRKTRDGEQGSAEGEDRIGPSGVGPGVATGAADGYTQTTAAQGAVHDRSIAPAFER